MKEAVIYSKLFSDRPEYYREFSRRLKKDTQTRLKVLFSKFLPLLNRAKGGTFYFLDIGGGTGNLTLPLIKKLKNSSGKSVILDYLEPSRQLYNVFQERIKKYRLESVVRKIILNNWESYSTKNRYDFILASQVWYGITKWENSFKKVYNLLRRNGIACIIIESKDNDFIRFKLRFLPLLYGNKVRPVYGTQICQTLDNLDLLYHREKITTQQIDISNYIDKKGEIDQKGKLFLSYLLRKNYDSLSDTVKIKIVSWLKNNSYRFILKSDFIWIFKLPQK